MHKIFISFYFSFYFIFRIKIFISSYYSNKAQVALEVVSTYVTPFRGSKDFRISSMDLDKPGYVTAVVKIIRAIFLPPPPPPPPPPTHKKEKKRNLLKELLLLHMLRCTLRYTFQLKSCFKNTISIIIVKWWNRIMCHINKVCNYHSHYLYCYTL